MECPSCGEPSAETARFCAACGAALGAPVVVASEGAALPSTVGGGRYRVQRMLGQGAKKRVYLATDERLGRDVAVAVIKTEGLDAAGRHRLEREAKAMARLGDHPNIVTVFDVGEDGDQPYIVSELMPGGSVADVLDGRPDHRLSMEEALAIAEQVARALAHAHARSIVHRDVKPANVWLASDGTARLGDFGLAVDVDRSRMTSEGMVIGTVAYLAPEQAVGRAPDARSDLYALGAFLYETLTGRPPFLGDDAVTVISQHLNTAPVAPTWHNAAVSAPVEALVLELLAKDPGARPASAEAVAENLARVRAGLTASHEEPSSPSATPSGRAASFGRFVGRAAELDSLKAMFDDVISGRTRLTMVVGEPGIGKTRLVEELGVYAAVRGAQVCWGHCYEGELGVPYLPFVEALRSYVRERSDDELRSQLSGGAPEVATLVSDLRARFPDIQVAPSLDGDAERMRLFEGIATFLASAAATRPLVLMLDDLHWADKPTLLLLQYLARNLRRDRVLLVGTYRDIELDRTHPLSDVIAALRREHLYERILLRGFDREEVKNFIEAVGEQETPDILADTIYRETEGNPFFVAEILRHLGESGALQRVDGQWVAGSVSVADELPEGVREVIGRRLSRLDDDCNRMLTVGSAMPGGFTLDAVALVLDADEDRVLDLLDEALERQLLRERQGQAGVYEFNHALIRQTLYSELSTPRRVRMHRQILAALESLYASNVDAHLTELAYHAFQAAPGGDVTKAVDYATRAGKRAASSAAHEEAARSYDLALQALELNDASDEQTRAELLLALGEAQRNAGEADGARTALRTAFEIGATLDDPDIIAEAAMIYSGLRFTTSTDPLQTHMLEEAFARRTALDDARRARLLARLGSHIAFTDAPRHAALAAEAVEAAKRSGDPGAMASALAAENYVGWSRSDLAELSQARSEVARLAALSGDIELRHSAQNGLFIDGLHLGDREMVDRATESLQQLAAESRSPAFRWVEVVGRMAIAVMDGRYAEAEELGPEALAVTRRLQDRTAVATIGVAWFPMLREQGRSADLEGPTRRAVAENPLVAAWRAGLTQVLADQGKLDEAGQHLAEIAREEFGSVGDDVLRTYTLAALAEVTSVLRDGDLARQLYGLLQPRAGFSVLLGNSAYHGAVDRYLGLLSMTTAEHDAAVRHHEAAAAIHERMRARTWLARSRYDLGRALVMRDLPGDRDRAFHLLNDALDVANDIGMTKLVQEVLTDKLEMQGIASGTSVTASIDIVAAGVSIERPNLQRHAAADGTVTVLFSDVEGYTRLNERLGDARTQTFLRVHDGIVRETVATHSGTVVKTAGDGYMIVFPDPVKGLACAVELQRAMAARDFGTDVGTVRVRIGLHSGEVIHEGDDFFGRTVILASRIAAEAQGGEVLISQALAARAETGEHGGKLGPARELTLKGIRDTHTVYRLDW